MRLATEGTNGLFLSISGEQRSF